MTRLFAIAWTCLIVGACASSANAAGHALGPQYDTTHVYVAAGDFDRFVASVLATFGGKATPKGVFQVTPTPSRAASQLVLTPVGSLSVFGFETPVPYPFGAERGGYQVDDIDAAVADALRAGAVRVVETFPDPIGRDVVVQWPGGVTMQLYWHITKSEHPPLSTIPEDRVYVTADAADRFVAAWKTYSGGMIVADDATVPGDDIGLPGRTYRRITVESAYGIETVLVTNGASPWPYGRERTGYAVDDLDATIAKAGASGVHVLRAPYRSGDGRAAMLQFPGGYIAEVHEARSRATRTDTNR